MKELTKRETIFYKFMEMHCFSVLQYISVKGIKDENSFKKSIELLLEKYEIFQNIIIKEEEKYYFKQVNDYKKKFFEENYELIEKEEKEEEQWKREMDNELTEGVMKFIKSKEESSLLIRIKFLHQKNSETSGIIISYFHGILDGPSLMILINELFSFLSKIQNNEEVKFEIKKKYEKEELKIDNTKKEINYLPLQCNIKELKDKKEIFKIKKIESKELTTILKKCKENGVTFTNFLSSCLVFSIIQNICKTENYFFDLTTVVTLRNYMNLKSDEIGEFMSAVVQYIEIDSKYNKFNQDLLWETAKKIKNEVNELINK
jgi:hypothetical protein